MTALCARRRDLKTAPIEFSGSTTEKSCHCIRNKASGGTVGFGFNFSKHITRSHGRFSKPKLNTERTEALSTQRETLGTKAPGPRNCGGRPGLQGRSYRDPRSAADRTNRTLKNDPSQLPSSLRASRASPSRLRVKGCGTRRTDSKCAYIIIASE
jgi:hypothetical protein